jgi:RecA-family ATPase
MRNNVGKQLVVLVGLVLLLLSAGCTKSKNVIGSDAGGLPQLSNFADDIKDITLPVELVWDRKDSMVIKTESFRGGIFSYKGRAEIMSLKDYMVASMKDNKWRLVGETASKNIMLAFVKPNKTCMMVIAEGVLGKTELKLYVAIDKTGGNNAGSLGSQNTFTPQNSFDSSFSQ